jgi:NTE family protein
MTTAFVLPGGGSSGAVQVGMLRALAGRDIAPDILVGTLPAFSTPPTWPDMARGQHALDDLAQVGSRPAARTCSRSTQRAILLTVGDGRASLFPDRALRRHVPHF